MKSIGIISTLMLFVSCSNGQTSIDIYTNQSFEFDQQKINDPKLDFTLSIPSTWNWKTEEYNDENIISGMDASSQPDKNGFIDLISIQKVKSFGGKKDLKSEFDYLLNLTKQQSQMIKLLGSGETKIFKYTAYFIHTKSETGPYGASESISFILESGTEGIFYYLNAGASQTDDLVKNMSIIIQCLKTFELITED